MSSTDTKRTLPPGVQQACLALQERCGADVNLLLFCGWTGRGGRALDESVLRSAVDRVGRWQSEVIAPLRLARRGLKRHAADAMMALRMARDVYTRRQEGVSIWVVPSNSITASDPDSKDEMFDPAADKIYRHPTFYKLPDEVDHM